MDVLLSGDGIFPCAWSIAVERYLNSNTRSGFLESYFMLHHVEIAQGSSSPRLHNRFGVQLFPFLRRPWTYETQCSPAFFSRSLTTAGGQSWIS